MVVINTKKIFITFLVSALLLVGSALTVFAFDFSAPDYNDSNININYYEGYGYEMYNYIDIDGDEQQYFQYVGSFKAFYDNEPMEPTIVYHLTLSKYGFDFLSQNGANAQSMKSVLDDFIDGNIGYIIALVGKYSPKDCYLSAGGKGDLRNTYQEMPERFDVITDLNNQFFNYESQYNTLNSQLAELRYQYNALSSQYQQLLTDYQNLQIIKNDLQTSINTLVSENSALYSQLAELQNQYNTLESQYNALQTSYNDLNNTFVSMRDYYQEEISTLQNNLSYAQNLADELSTQVFDLQQEINRLKDVNAEEYMRGYTQAMDDNDLFAEGLYSIFSAPFTLVAEIAEIEIFGTSIVKIVGIVLLFVVLSIVLGFLWKILPLV